MNKIVRSSRRLTTTFTRKWAGCLALCLTPAALAACTSGGAATSDVATTTQALDTASCGYTLSTDVGKANKNGFKVKLKIASADGSHLNTTGLTILIDSGAAQLTHVAHGSFTTSENGYLLSTIGGDDSGDTETDADVLSGKAYSFNLQFSGTYSKFVANVMSNSGVNCDQTAPSVKLTTSGGKVIPATAASMLVATASVNMIFSAQGSRSFTSSGSPRASHNIFAPMPPRRTKAIQ